MDKACVISTESMIGGGAWLAFEEMVQLELNRRRRQCAGAICDTHGLNRLTVKHEAEQG